MAVSLLLSNCLPRNPRSQTLHLRPTSNFLLHEASLFPNSLPFSHRSLAGATACAAASGGSPAGDEDSEGLGSRERKVPSWVVLAAILGAALLVFDAIWNLNFGRSRRSSLAPIASLSDGIQTLLKAKEAKRPAFCDGSINTKKKLNMVFGASDIPKKKPQGEDAYFVCEAEQTMGVADGVGSWAKKGIDAGEYARQLMANSVTAVLSEPKGAIDPKRVLQEAYSNTKAEGSSTALIVTLRGGNLYASNVGDSGFALFRGTKCIYQSPLQHHGFNYPFQLGNGESSDNPSSSIELTVGVEPGDVVVVGTDGLFDNVYAAEIESLLGGEAEDGMAMDPKRLALELARLAQQNSFNRDRCSPFAKAAQVAGSKYRGGKPDDITVVVAHIVDAEGSNLNGSSVEDSSLNGSSVESSNPNESSVGLSNPNGSSVELSNPNGSSVELSNPNGSSVESSNPNESSVESSNPTGSSVESSNPNGSSVESSNPNGSYVESSNPNGSSVELSNRNGSSVESSNPNGSCVELSNLNGSSDESSNPNESSVGSSNPIGSSVELSNPNGSSVERLNVNGSSVERLNVNGSSVERSNLNESSIECSNLNESSVSD